MLDNILNKISENEEEPIGTETKEVPKCQEGMYWCPRRKKCISGEKPKMENKTIDEANKLLDQVLEEVKESQNSEYQLSILLMDDILENMEDQARQLRVTTNPDGTTDEFDDEEEVESPSSPDNPDKETNSLNNVPNQDAESELNAMKMDIGEAYHTIIRYNIKKIKENTEYKKFFQSMLAKHGVKSPSELSGDKKKAFFRKINQTWKSKEESD